MTHSRQDISRLLAEHGLSPRRAFGQNFVADANTVHRIARLANIGPDDLVIEIGAGLGSLTLALAETGAAVTAIEIDHGIAPVLRRVVANRSNVSVVEGDARTIDWKELIPPGRRAVVVANLPYNVATPLIADLLDTVPQIHRFVVMVQKEVALRLAASPGTPDYGAISVKVAYWATARLLGDVPSTVFVPQPKVTSSIIEIIRRDSPAVDIDPRQLFALVRTAFGQRRKMLRRSLADVVDMGDFDRAGIPPTARPEELDVVTWGRLAHTVHSVVHTTVIEAPAKLTLSLRVTGAREDGYHLIDSVMTSLDLCDEIRVSELRTSSATSDEGVVASRSHLEFIGPYADGIPTDSTNLVHRALDFVERSAAVSATKNIPHGGGLGGGSTNAAAIIRWAGRTSPDDVTASASIGADVPFCVRGGRAIVRGIGEVIEPLPYVDEEFTLVVPPLRVSTPAVYRAWDELGGPHGDNGNDLEPAAIRVEPELAQWRDRIHRACGIRPTLAGSGATWFVPGHHPELVEALPDAEVRLVRTRPSEL
jgi:ribosomal RNA small subunit methyltransferase A/4-diphosphocytidyl-2C-methyl-D-erythritol kinase